MRHKRRRNAATNRATHAQADKWIETRRQAAKERAVNDSRKCPRCDSPITPSASGRGRPRVWCSQRCRRAAYEERRAAANGAIAKAVVTRNVEPPWDEIVERVLKSPMACRRVLQALTEKVDQGELLYGPWDLVSADLWKLNTALARQRSSRS